MGRQLNQILSDLSTITSGTSVINVNLTDIEALLTTLQADVANERADGSKYKRWNRTIYIHIYQLRNYCYCQ